MMITSGVYAQNASLQPKWADDITSDKKTVIDGILHAMSTVKGGTGKSQGRRKETGDARLLHIVATGHERSGT